MTHGLRCPDCRTPLTYSPERCEDCGWRPWYRTPATLGMALLTVVTLFAVANLLVRMDTPLFPYSLLEGKEQGFTTEWPEYPAASVAWKHASNAWNNHYPPRRRERHHHAMLPCSPHP